MATVDPYRSNPFRVLGIRSSASNKETGRSADRLLKWIELNEAPQTPDLLPHLGSSRRGRDEIKNAVKEIEDPRSRIHAELFWPSCEFSGFDACQELLTAGRYSEFVALCEQAIANGAEREHGERSVDASLACHFLAVFYHSAAVATTRHEKDAVSDGTLPADWTQAFRYWTLLIKDEVFWEHLARRAKLLEDPRVNADYVAELRQELPGALVRTNVSRAVASAEGDDFEEMAFQCWIIQNAQLGPAGDRALKVIVGALQPRFESALREINSSLTDSAIKTYVPAVAPAAGEAEATYDPQRLRQYLSAVEVGVNSRVVPAARAVQRAGLSTTQAASDILDGVAYVFRGICLAFTNYGRMPRESLRLTAVAREFATSAQCTARLDEDYRALQLLALKQEASELAAESRYKESLAKLEEARPYATSTEERRSLEQWLEAARGRIAFEGFKPITSAPGMFTFNGIGTKLYGSRDYDSRTGTHVSTLYFTFVFLPILPLASYRVRHVGGSRYQFFGTVPMKRSALAGPAVVALCIAVLIILANLGSSTPAASTSGTGSTGSSSPADEPPNDQQPYESRASLRQRLEQERTRLSTEENQLAYEKMQIDIQRPTVMFTQNKAELRRFNERVRVYNARLHKHQADVKTFNSQIDQYNLTR